MSVAASAAGAAVLPGEVRSRRERREPRSAHRHRSLAGQRGGSGAEAFAFVAAYANVMVVERVYPRASLRARSRTSKRAPPPPRLAIEPDRRVFVRQPRLSDDVL